MGNDGGSFAHRSEIVKTKKKHQKVDNHHQAQMKSAFCTLSKEPISKPICVCKLGNLYNKEQIIKRLIDKNMPKSGFEHIKKIKDVVEVPMVLNQNYKIDPQDGSTLLMCPITSTAYNGFSTFHVNWPCGCIFSKKALDEINQVCGK